MERFAPLPFAKGKLELTLGITGPIEQYESAEYLMDDLFRLFVKQAMSPLTPKLNRLTDDIEVEDGETKVSVSLQTEILDNLVTVHVDVVLGYVFSEEVIKVLVIGCIGPDMLSTTTGLISDISYRKALGDAHPHFKDPMVGMTLRDLLGESGDEENDDQPTGGMYL